MEELVQIVDAALAEAARRGGAWLVCRPGCTQCCVGPFAIDSRDASRLRRGLETLQLYDPERAARVRSRARDSVARIGADFPGCESEDFPNFANDEPCPVLDPATGLCDLYEWRPIICRLFGPAIRTGPGALGVCELCFVGATDQEIAACEVEVDLGPIEAESDATIVALCLTRE